MHAHIKRLVYIQNFYLQKLKHVCNKYIVIYRVMSGVAGYLLYIRLHNRIDIHICFIFLDVVKLEMLYTIIHIKHGF